MKLLFFITVLGLLSCTPQAPTNFGSSDREQNKSWSCSNLQINTDVLSVTDLRLLADCLNGKEGRLAPFKAINDSMTDDQLQVLVDVYNQDFRSNSHQFNQALDLMLFADRQGLIQQFSEGLSQLIQTNWLQTLSPLAAKLLQKDTFQNEYRELFLKVIKDPLSDGYLAEMATFLNGKPLQLAGSELGAFSQNNVAFQKTFAQKTDRFIQELLRSPNLTATFEFLAESQPRGDLLKGIQLYPWGVRKLVYEVLQDSEPQLLLFDRVAEGVRATNRSFPCFSRAGTPRTFDNFFEGVSDLISQRWSSEESLEHFLIVESPILGAAFVDRCQVSAEAKKQIILTRDTLRELGSRGAGHGVGTLLVPFYRQGRLAQFSDILQSKQLRDFLVLLQMGQKAGATIPLVDALLVESSEGFHQKVSNGAQIALANEATLRKVALEILEEIDKEKIPLAKMFFRTLVSEARPISSLFATAARFDAISRENPIETTLLKILEDPSRSKKLSKTISVILAHPQWPRAIELVQSLADRGELQQLIMHLVKIFRKERDVQPTSATEPWLTPSQAYTNSTPVVKARGRQLLGQVEACFQIPDTLFSPQGEALKATMQCLDPQKTKGFWSLSEILSQKKMMAPLSALMRDQVLSERNLAHALEELWSMSKRQLLTRWGKLGKIIEENKILNASQPVLKALVGGPEVEMDRFLLCTAETLPYKDFRGVIELAADIFNQKERLQFFEFAEPYKLKVANEGELRKQALELGKKRKWSTEKTEAAFQTALKEHIYRDEDYFYKDGLFPRLTDEQMAQELIAYFTELFQSPNAEEALWGLKDINDGTIGVKLAEFFEGAIVSPKVNWYWKNADEEPRLRIVTPLDQLEILVQNADISLAPYFKIPGEIGKRMSGVDHMGTFFQKSVADSPELKKSMRDLNSVLDLGKLYTWMKLPEWMRDMNEHRKRHYVLNMNENFDVLHRIAATGELKIFQRLYQGLLRATPPQYRELQDPVKNKMGLTHRFLRWGLFSRLVFLLNQMRDQGVLKPVVQQTFQLFAKMSDSDRQILAKALRTLTVSHNNKPPMLHQIIRFFIKTSSQPQRLAQIKKAIFHLVPSLGGLVLQSSGSVEAAQSVLSNTALIQKIWDRFVQAVEGDEIPYDEINTKATVLLTADESLRRAMAGYIQLWNAKPQRSDKACMATVVDLVLRAADLSPGNFEAFMKQLSVLSRDERLKNLNVKELFQDILSDSTHPDGLRLQLYAILKNDSSRETIQKFLSVLAEEKHFESLSKTMINFVDSGELERWIWFFNTHLKTGLNPGEPISR